MVEKQIIINDLLVNYVEENSQAETVAVFLHGWQASAQTWKKVFEKLEDKPLRLIAIDLPGFGKSPLPKTVFGVGDYAEFVKSFLLKINLEKVILIGHSFGGRISIKLTASNPELVSKLVLVDSAGFKTYEAIVQAKALISKIVKPIFALPGIRELKNPIFKLVGSNDYIEAGPLKEIFVKVINEDLTPYLSQIKAPTLLVWGENDEETPVEFGQKMNTLIPNSSLTIFPNAGHFSFLDQKEKFISELEKFIL